MSPSRALWTVAPGRMELRPAALEPAELTLRALWSGVSRGTESLVLRGQVPESEHATMRCPHQDGAFPFPVKYGYAMVAEIVDGPADRLGERCFLLHPHQDAMAVAADAVLPLPEGLPPRRAVLAANMETALNVVWDAGIGPGDRVFVAGAGVVGLLIGALAAGIPGTEVTLSDPNPARAATARALGLRIVAPEDAPRDTDVAINASGQGAGLQAALDALGVEGVAVEASWHGAGTVPLALGGAFHSRRLTIRSSQVGRLPPARAPRWTFRRRLAVALGLLRDRPALDALISHEIAFADAARDLPPLLGAGSDALCIALRYS